MPGNPRRRVPDKNGNPLDLGIKTLKKAGQKQQIPYYRNRLLIVNESAAFLSKSPDR